MEYQRTRSKGPMPSDAQNALLELGIEHYKVELRELSECDLSGAKLSGLDLKGFTISRANLENAEFVGSDLRGLDFTAANCVGAAFVGADLRGARLCFGYFHAANFSGADLRGAKLQDALCNDAVFAGADLRGAEMGFGHYGSDFRGADLRGVIAPAESDFEKLNCDIQGASITPSRVIPVRNKRKHKRIPVVNNLPVFDRRTREEFGNLVDITLEGLKIASRHPTPIGATCYCCIKLPDNPISNQLCVDLKSMWCKPHDASRKYFTGFRIQKISEDGRRLIAKIIDDQLTRRKEVTD
ncbi:MAG: hypothetical protein GF398_20800 [Chitinivibrionales bacterium]|nr:hypothetical protein [Chitinivibrionales bacterium]